MHSDIKVKQHLDRPWGFQEDEDEAPRFQDSRRMKVVRMSALRTGRLYPQGHNDIGNRTRDLLTCSAVTQPTAQRRAPVYTVKVINWRMREAGHVCTKGIYERHKNFCSLRCSVITFTLKMEAGNFCKMSSTQLVVMIMQKFRKGVSIVTESPSNVQLIANGDTAWTIFSQLFYLTD